MNAPKERFKVIVTVEMDSDEKAAVLSQAQLAGHAYDNNPNNDEVIRRYFRSAVRESIVRAKENQS